MELQEVIIRRRAYQSIEKTGISEDDISKLARAASLAPSCFNNQPWRFIFITDEQVLQDFQQVYSRGNQWAWQASLVIAVFSHPENDCVIKDREYYQFDTGLAAGFLMLQATELGLVAHPIAGFSPRKVREILAIPEEMKVITLIIVGRQVPDPAEADRPPRKPLAEFCSRNRFGRPL